MKIDLQRLGATIAEQLEPAILEAIAPKETYTTEDAASYLCLSKSTLNHLRSQGSGPKYSRLERRIVYRKKDLDEFLDSKVQKTNTGSL